MKWKNLMQQKNSSSDISPTAGQMPRLVGLALASKFYRNNKAIQEIENFIESNPSVTLQNVLRLFGDEHINEGVIRGWFPALKNEIGNIDEIYDIPLSAFDGERLPEINDKYLRTLLKNIKTITKVYRKK
jgi:hypothetical protein